jgi:RNA polymerase sigma factor for flagellar operon FliA
MPVSLVKCSGTSLASIKGAGVLMTVKSERESRIIENHALVAQIARRLSAKYPSCVELDDLISIGTLGLIDAADRFDISFNINFSCYARIRIKGSIVDALRKADWVPRLIRSRQRLYLVARSALEASLGRSCTQSELAVYLRTNGVQDFKGFHVEANVIPLVSTEDKRLNEDQRLGDTLKSVEPPLDEKVSKLRQKKRVAKAIQALSDREQKIVEMYYFNGMSLRAIGDFLGLTESRICQLHNRIRKRMKTILATEEIEQAA